MRAAPALRTMIADILATQPPGSTVGGAVLAVVFVHPDGTSVTSVSDMCHPSLLHERPQLFDDVRRGIAERKAKVCGA